MSNAAIEVTYRSATLDEIDTVVQLMREFYRVERLEFEEAFTRSVLSEFLQTDAYGYLWLIEVGSAIAGYVAVAFGYSLELGGRDALIDELYLRDDFRGRGLGTRTLEAVQQRCQDLGVVAVHLVVDNENPRARSLYERVGFRVPSRTLMSKPVAFSS